MKMKWYINICSALPQNNHLSNTILDIQKPGIQLSCLQSTSVLERMYKLNFHVYQGSDLVAAVCPFKRKGKLNSCAPRDFSFHRINSSQILLCLLYHGKVHHKRKATTAQNHFHVTSCSTTELLHLSPFENSL